MNKIKIKRMNMSENEYRSYCNNDDGYCVNCGDITRFGMTEPDARRYPCDECGKNTVFGIEESLLCGYINIE